MNSPKIRKIVSGGQTGADRAALDFALAFGIETSGFVQKNRRAEDGKIPKEYPNLIETETENLAERTELNVIHSDATLILSHGVLLGGSLLTTELAANHRKPFLHIDFLISTMAPTCLETRKWLNSIECEVLNVAGSRASEDAEIYSKTRKFLENLFTYDMI